jgi:hypothetical protein
MHEDIELIRQAGTLLFGEFWQRSIARALGPLHPDGARNQVDDRLVRRWVAGQRDIPGWVLTGTATLLDQERRELESSCLRMHRLASEMRKIRASQITPHESFADITES